MGVANAGQTPMPDVVRVKPQEQGRRPAVPKGAVSEFGFYNLRKSSR